MQRGNVLQELPRWHSGEETRKTQETQVRFLGGENPLEQEWQPTPIFLARKIPLTEEPGRAPWGRKELDMTDWARMHA